MVETVAQLAWLVLFLPLAAAASITLFTQRNGRLSAGLSIGAAVLAFLGSIVLFSTLPHDKAGVELSLRWLSVGPLQVQWGVRLDVLGEMMLLIVTGVGSVIHIYSYGYMD